MKLRNETVKEIRRLYTTGLTIRAIAVTVGCSKNSVQKYLTDETPQKQGVNPQVKCGTKVLRNSKICQKCKKPKIVLKEQVEVYMDEDRFKGYKTHENRFGEELVWETAYQEVIEYMPDVFDSTCICGLPDTIRKGGIE